MDGGGEASQQDGGKQNYHGGETGHGGGLSIGDEQGDQDHQGEEHSSRYKPCHKGILLSFLPLLGPQEGA